MMHDRSPSPNETAADWVSRLHVASPDDSDFARFEAWLAASPEHVEAYNRAEALWLELDANRVVLLHADATGSDLSPAVRRAPLAWMGVVAAIATLGALWLFSTPEAQVYQTASGETRSITLSDGSSVRLNTATRIEASIGPFGRRVVLADGEAIFSVKHDARRPFTVLVDRYTFRDVGTEFDLLSHKKRIVLAVRSGAVDVTSTGTSPSIRVDAGSTLIKAAEGGTWSRTSTAANDAFSWSGGYLIYRHASMADVASDLSRYVQSPVSVDGSLDSSTFSGVIQIGTPEEMLRHLEAIAPVRVDRGSNGVRLIAKP